MTLDGAVTALVHGPKRSEVGVRLAIDGHTAATSRRRGRTDSLSGTACRSADTATLTFTAIRKGGRGGPVNLAVSYPG
jgi:hypothetical protein